MNTDSLLLSLSKKYPSPAYAFLTQVRNGTGYERNARTADAMVMSLWPSRGIELIGFELKVSRGDWLRELKDPQKAEDLAQFCDRWYVVAPDEKVISVDEVPAAWGLILANGRGGAAKTIKEAPLLKAKPVDRLFLAAMMRNVAERTMAKELVDAEVRTRVEGCRESWKKSEESAREELNKIRGIISDFERLTGLHLSTWGTDDNLRLAKTVKQVMAGKHVEAGERLKRMKETALNIAKFIDGEIQGYQI